MYISIKYKEGMRADFFKFSPVFLVCGIRMLSGF